MPLRLREPRRGVPVTHKRFQGSIWASTQNFGRMVQIPLAEAAPVGPALQQLDGSLDYRAVLGDPCVCRSRLHGEIGGLGDVLRTVFDRAFHHPAPGLNESHQSLTLRCLVLACGEFGIALFHSFFDLHILLLFQIFAKTGNRGPKPPISPLGTLENPSTVGLCGRADPELTPGGGS